jgi:hypothetical protein
MLLNAGMNTRGRVPTRLRLVKWANAHNLAVIGAEVWVPSPKGPIIPARYVYVWSLGRSRRHASEAKTALDYVRVFEWDPNDRGFLESEPFFNLTIDEE